MRNIFCKPDTRNEHGNSLNSELDVITALYVWLVLVLMVAAALGALAA